jgi:hypothetical protein
MNTIESPHLLDVVRSDTIYILQHDGVPCKTPHGKLLAHTEPRLLHHIIRSINTSVESDPFSLTPYGLLCYQLDCVENNVPPLPIVEMIEEDPLIRRSRGASGEFIEQLADDQQALSFILGGMTSVIRALDNLLMEYGIGTFDVFQKEEERCIELAKSLLISFTSEQQCAFLALSQAHESGVFLPLLLLLQRLTPSEYANALFTIHATSEKQLSSPVSPLWEGEHTLPDWTLIPDSFAQIREHSVSAIEYTSYTAVGTQPTSGIVSLIRGGESFTLEFKTSLRWNIHASKKDTAIEHANLKTISAFLNSSGGTLLIGVRDDGSIEGLALDGFPSTDKFLLHFWNLVKSSMGEDICPFIVTSFESVAEKEIFVVKCTKSPRPVFLNQKGFSEEFYIRSGPSSTSLSIQDATKYMKHRFG